MNYEKNSDLKMTFKIPTEEDFQYNKREYWPLSSKKYLDFIELGLKLNPNIKKAFEFHKKHAPKVRFEL